MRYFKYEPNFKLALLKWEQSQYDLSDIVLYLTDRNIIWGYKIYALFSQKEIRVLLNYFVCDLLKIKQDLGINFEYVERDGNCYSQNYNPKRDILKPASAGIQSLAKVVYNQILQDLEEICEKLKYII